MAAAIQSHDAGDRPTPPSAEDLHWAFSEDANGRWLWQVTARNGHVIVRSAIRFGSRAECVADAKRYGYAEDAWHS